MRPFLMKIASLFELDLDQKRECCWTLFKTYLMLFAFFLLQTLELEVDLRLRLDTERLFSIQLQICGSKLLVRKVAVVI